MKIYKIRDKNTRLYTSGGRYAESNFGKNGKDWFSEKDIIAFLQFFIRDNKVREKEEINLYNQNLALMKRRKNPPPHENKKIFIEKISENYIPENWEIVEFEVKETSAYSARSYLKEKNEK